MDVELHGSSLSHPHKTLSPNHTQRFMEMALFLRLLLLLLLLLRHHCSSRAVQIEEEEDYTAILSFSPFLIYIYPAAYSRHTTV
jgi:hypothetical protein